MGRHLLKPTLFIQVGFLIPKQKGYLCNPTTTQISVITEYASVVILISVTLMYLMGASTVSVVNSKRLTNVS